VPVRGYPLAIANERECRVQDARYWAVEFWNGLSLLDLVGGALLGTILGLALGVAVWIVLARRGGLARRRRWHHWLVASYVVVVPLLFAFIGLQVGLVAGGQRALYKQIDHFQPHLQGAMEHWLVDFQQTLDTPELQAMLRDDVSAHEAARAAVGTYLSGHRLADAGVLSGEGLAQRWARKAIEHLRSKVMLQWVEDSLVEQVGSRSGLDETVFREALGMRMSELLHTRGVIRLLKAQVGSMMPGIYLGLLLPLLIVMALVLLEIWLAARYGWGRQPRPGAVVVPAPG